MSTTWWRPLTVFAILSASVAACGQDGAQSAEASDFSPGSPECLAPADPGGGWDLTCRSIGEVLEDLDLTSNVVVTNQPGGGGGVALTDVAANRDDDDDLLVAASPATAIRFSQNQYEGITADEFRWIGGIATDFGVIAVSDDSPYESFDQLIKALKADPGSIVFGGGSPLGGQDHIKVLLLAEELGIDPTAIPWVAYDGGGEAQNGLLGDEIDVFPGDVSEIIGNEDLRVLAVLADEPVSVLPDVPTTHELGYDTSFPIWRGLVAPGSMSDEAYAFWVDALDQVEASNEWAAIREESGLAPMHLLGDDFEEMVFQSIDDFADLSEPLGVVK